VDEAELRADQARYFADPAAPHSTIHPGAAGAHCRNIRLALMRLGFDESFGSEPLDDSFTHDVSSALKRFQAARGHTSVDGLCGPGTRALLVNTLLDHVAEQDGRVDPFARMIDPERRAEGAAFISYAREDRAHVERFAELIRQWGYNPWYDVGINGGEKFSDTLMLRIEEAYLVIVFETPRSVTSEWVLREVEFAAAQSVRVLPIEVEPVSGEAPLSRLLSRYHRIGPAPETLSAPETRSYRMTLKQALRDAHRSRAVSRDPGRRAPR